MPLCLKGRRIGIRGKEEILATNPYSIVSIFHNIRNIGMVWQKF
jgi:hypothetical protein